MATVYVGSASIDENGKAHGGKAGNQSGRELRKQAYYVHKKGWRVFRALDPIHAAAIAKCMTAAINNKHIGYDQYERNTLYKCAAPYDFDVSKVQTNCETDCSALVRVCCAYAGIAGLPADFRTGNMPSYLLKTGMFVELTGSKYQRQSLYLGAGDILVTRTSGHTVVVLNNGAKYEGTVQKVDYALGGRIIRHGCEGADVIRLQEDLIALGCDLGQWGADGEFGAATEAAVKAYQAARGLDADGIAGEKTLAAIAADLDALGDADSPTEPIEPEGNLTLKDGSWNVRTGPGTGYPVAKTVHGGDRLAEVNADGWTPVRIDGEVQWISEKALTRKSKSKSEG